MALAIGHGNFLRLRKEQAKRGHYSEYELMVQKIGCFVVFGKILF